MVSAESWKKPAPLFPEVQNECTRLPRVPYPACINSSASATLTSIGGAEDKRYEKLRASKGPFTQDEACATPAAWFSAALQIQGDLRYTGHGEVGSFTKI